MSHKIGIVCEGISDYKILKHIVERYLRDCDVYTIPLKPKITPQGKQEGFGTWQGVLNYIKGDDGLILEAIKEGCLFVIIQIDTDVCEEYGVTKDTADISEFYDNVKNKLAESIHPDFNLDQAIYAICIHEIECWLIPFICTSDCDNIDRCLNIINHQIRRTGATIDKENKNSPQAAAVYENILRHKRKVRDIQVVAQYNYGFQQFINQLNVIQARLL